MRYSHTVRPRHTPIRADRAYSLRAARASLAAAALASLALSAIAGGAAASDAVVAPLITRDLIGMPGKEVTMETVVYAPGGKSPPHRHNAQVFVYVLSEGDQLVSILSEPDAPCVASPRLVLAKVSSPAALTGLQRRLFPPVGAG